MKKQYNEINDSVTINFNVPEALRYLMEEAEEADIKNDGSYFNLADTIDTVSKNCCADGLINESQWNTINRRYPQ